MADGSKRLLLHYRGVRRKASPALTVEEILTPLTSFLDVDQLIQNFTAKLKEKFSSRAVYFLLFEPITERYTVRKGKGEEVGSLSGMNFSKTDLVIRWLNVNQCPLVVTAQPEVLKYLSEAERRLLLEGEIRVVVPLFVMNRLTGILFVGRKVDTSDYSSQEINLMSSLAGQSGLAIEYAMMHQFQAERLRSLFHADKLATIGELAAGAAHEIRNPLAAIRSTVQFIGRDLTAEKKELADGLIEEVDRIDQIVNGLLSFSRMHELQFELVDIHSVLDQTLFLVEPELGRADISVTRDYRLKNPVISADPAQLKQVFLNIFLNSIQAMSDGGKLEILTRLAPRNKGFIAIDVKDTGAGISPSALLKVFDPFYTTKDNGTGLGLSISYGIIARHGGEISITSNQGGTDHWTSVAVKLPTNKRE